MFCIGSCRSCYCFNIENYPNDFIHSTKEVLQLLQLKNKNITYTDELRLINRNFSNQNRLNYETNRIYEKISNADVIIIEISSIKTVFNNKSNMFYNYDLYSNVINKDNLKNNKKSLYKLYRSKNIRNNSVVEKQSKHQIQDDLDKIYNYLVNELNKKIILIPNINATFIDDNNIKYQLPNRILLCDTLEEFSNKQNIFYFNPMKYLIDDPSKIFNNGDGCHYSKESSEIITKSLHEFINAI
jgi:hypothetical protein